MIGGNTSKRPETGTKRQARNICVAVSAIRSRNVQSRVTLSPGIQSFPRGMRESGRIAFALAVTLAAVVIVSGIGTLFFNDVYGRWFDVLLGGFGLGPAYVSRFAATPEAYRLSALHILPGIAWMIIMPLQFSRLRKRSLPTHRALGRVFLICAAIAWIGMLGMLTMPFSDDSWELLPNLLFGGLFLVSGVLAFWHIRHKRVVQHREWIIRHVSVGMGIALMRPVALIGLQTGAIEGSVASFKLFFPHLFWLCFVLSVATAEIWINVTRTRAHTKRQEPG